METEFAVLTLKVSDILEWNNNEFTFHNKRVENDIGIIENSKLNITWKALDFENILGEMYHKYDYFNIECVRFTTVPYTSRDDFDFTHILNSYSEKDNIGLMCNIHGLDFINSSYNTATKNHSKIAPLFILSNEVDYTKDVELLSHRFHEEVEISRDMTPWKDTGLLFYKQKYVDLNLYFLKLVDNEFPTGFTRAQQFPHWSVRFIIRPVITKQ